MISMKKIADAAGVSRTTVSFVLNGRYERDMKISPEIVRRVKDIAAEMGYVRNELVQSVVTGKSKVIAIIGHFYNFMMPIIRGYSETAAKYNYSITLISLDTGYPLEDALRIAIGYRVAGILLPGLTPEERESVGPEICKCGIPISGITYPSCLRGYFDQVRSAEIGVEYLASLGHRKIFCLATRNSITNLRIRGYENVMRRCGLQSNIWEPNSFDELVAARPEAVFCVTDGLAMLLLQYLYPRRIFIPEAFSLMGFGDSESALSAPSLTTISEPYYENGCYSVENLLHVINTGKPFTDFQHLVGKLIIRDSTVQNKHHKGGRK